MKRSVFPLLSAMMFLQFFIWGAWYVTTGQYMATHQMTNWIGSAYTVGPIAAIISPFFLGMIADRFFATERVLGVMHILGGIAMFCAPLAAKAGPQAFVGVLLLHMLCYMPTLGLTNTLAFHNLTNQEKQFPLIRVFGTIGWIVAGLIISAWLGADETTLPFQVAGGAGVLLGVFCFALPHTPPPAAGKAVTVREVLGLDSLALLKHPPFAVFVVASMLICIPLAAYYAFAQNFVRDAGFHAPAGVMTVGQMSEIIFMLLMPVFFVRLGVKWMLAVGMLAWFVRYGLFALGAPTGVMWTILGGIALHGICYDFFFVTGFIYTDKKAPREIRGQAQGFLVLVTQGIGLGLGAQLMQYVFDLYKNPKSAQLVEQATALRDQYKVAATHAAGGAEAAGALTKAEGLWQQGSALLLQATHWRGFWTVPCIFAAVILVLFVLLFRDDSKTAATTPQAEEAVTQH